VAEGSTANLLAQLTLSHCQEIDNDHLFDGLIAAVSRMH
jgi:hypothetical protein